MGVNGLKEYGLTFEIANCQRETPFVFSAHSSIGCGGFARTAYYPETVESLQSLIKALKEKDVPFYVVGNMTNVLPPDGESRRVFIVTKRLAQTDIDNGYFGAGVTSGALLRACRSAHKSGAEFLAGIPCTLGGALYMNAGAAGVYISEIVESVTVLRGENILVLPVCDCRYAYKTSVFMQNDDVILGGKLRLKTADDETIKQETSRFLERRKHLPKGKSMGCVFKNPDGATAGKLIDGAGLKGLRIGGAKVSEEHANFIINDKNATSAEIRTLIGIIKNAVFAQYKIRLQEEIRYLT